MMEEKERYIFIDLEERIELIDTENKTALDDADKIKDTLNQQSKRIKELEKENQQLKQSQKQLAIEELKLALENFRNRPTYFDVARQEMCLSDQDKQFIDFINNRIKELRSEE